MNINKEYATVKIKRNLVRPLKLLALYDKLDLQDYLTKTLTEIIKKAQEGGIPIDID